MADYTTVTDLKTYLHISGSADDALLADLITRASRIVDRHCHRHFAAVQETRCYDAVGSHITGKLLLLDADLLSLTTLTNGDGAVIDADDTILRPVNWPPYFGISLKASSGLGWTYTDDPEGAISVEGVWGYSAEPPPEIVQAVTRLAAWLYRQRDTGVDTTEVEVTERGTAAAPSRLPRDVRQMIDPFIRVLIKVY